MHHSTILIKSFYWKLLNFIVLFFANIILVRYFTAEVTSKFYSLVFINSLVISVFNLGLDISLNYYLSRKEISFQIARKYIFYVTIAALILSLPLISLYYQRIPWKGIRLRDSIIFSFLYISGGLLINLLNAVYTSLNKNHIISIIGLASSLVSLCLCLVSIKLFDRQVAINALYIIYFTFSFLPGLILFILLSKLKELKEDKDKQISTVSLKKLLNYSIVAFGINLTFFIASRLPVFILPFWTDVMSLGNYMQAYKIVEFVGMAAAFIYYPIISIASSSSNKETTSDLILFIVRLSNTFVLIVSITILLFGNTIFTIIYGKSFHLLNDVLICLLPGMLAVCTSTFFTAYFFGAKKHRVNLTSALILLISLFILLYVFARGGNVKGAAIAFSISNISSLIYDGIEFQKINKKQIQDFIFINSGDLKKIILLFKF